MTPPPDYYPERDDTRPGDSEQRVMHKLAGLIASSLGENGGFLLTDGSEFFLSIGPVPPEGVAGVTRTGRVFTVAADTHAQLVALLNADPVFSVLAIAANAQGLGETPVTEQLDLQLTDGTLEISEDIDETPTLVTAIGWNAGVDGPFRSVMAVGGDAVIALGTLTDEWGGFDALAGHTLLEGQPLVIGIQRVERTSGKIACYK